MVVFTAVPESWMKKYLWYQGGDLTGLNHQFDNLTSLIRDVLYLGRIPVVDPPRLHPRHNFGHPISTEWNRYIDITGITAFRAVRGGGWEPAGEPTDQGRVPIATAKTLDTKLSSTARAIEYTQIGLGAYAGNILILRDMQGAAGSLWANAALCPRNTYWIRLPPLSRSDRPVPADYRGAGRIRRIARTSWRQTGRQPGTGARYFSSEYSTNPGAADYEIHADLYSVRRT